MLAGYEGASIATNGAEPIRAIGDEVLRQKAEEVSREMFGTDELKDIVDRMYASMVEAQALIKLRVPFALAAPQIGVSRRIFYIRGNFLFKIMGWGPARDQVFINPTVVEHSKSTKAANEGCTSAPNEYHRVRRYQSVTVKAYGENGKEFQVKAKGLYARIVQHECDHLDGVLYTDRAPGT
jgi:peptide deformylase